MAEARGLPVGQVAAGTDEDDGVTGWRDRHHRAGRHDHRPRPADVVHTPLPVGLQGRVVVPEVGLLTARDSRAGCDHQEHRERRHT